MKKITIIKTITNRETESIDRYFREVNSISLLTKDEEVELAKKIKENNDIASINKLVLSNLRFVISVAKQFQNQGLSIEDLISEGNIGLIISAKKFDYTKGFKFISYAVWWIRQSIIQSLAEHSRLISLPLNQVNKIIKIKKISSQLEQKYERLPSYDEISDSMGFLFNTKKVSDILRLNEKCISIDEPIKSGNSETYTLCDIIENKESLSPDNNITDKSITNQIEKSLDNLNEKERKIITLFFGLNNSNRMTLDAIGKKIGLSKERIRQIKAKSIRKIRFNYEREINNERIFY